MKNALEIKWPWEMVHLECVEDFIDTIKEFLPADHELQAHELFPGIKWDERPVFIIDDDTTGEYLLMDFEKTTRWKKVEAESPDHYGAQNQGRGRFRDRTGPSRGNGETQG